MTKTSRKSVSQAAPKKKPVTSTKRTPVKKTTTVTKKRPITATKKATTAKKATPVKKRTTTRTKAPVKDKVNNVSPASKTARKATSKASSRKTSHTTGSTTKRAPKKETVILPTRMSIRAREKALVLADTFEKDFYSAGVTIAKVTGFSFLLIGTLVTYTQLSHTSKLDACTDDACTVAQVSSALDSTQLSKTDSNTNVEIELLATIPAIIEEPVGIPIELSSAVTANAHVQYLTDGGREQTQLPLKAIGNQKYELYVDPEQLPPNQYELKVDVQHKDTAKMTSYSLGYFAIIVANNPDDASETEQTKVQTATTSPAREASNEQEVEKTAAAGELSDSEITTDITNIDQFDGDTATQNEITPEADPDADVVSDNSIQNDDTALDVPVGTNESIRIVTDSIISGTANVSVENATKDAIVSFHIRPVQTLNTQFLGQLITGTRTFRFDSKQFPNGQYQLYAMEQHGGEVGKSNTAEITIQNQIIQERVAQASSTTPQRQLFDITNELQGPGTDESVSDELLARQNQATSTTDVQDRARAVLRGDAVALDDLFQRYAVAEQSGDVALQTEVKKAIQNYREDIISAALNSASDRLIANELDVAIERELNELTQKVQTFEAIRSERSELDAATDTDGDGVTDFDEITLYKTDPLSADTDNDGFTDGAEIVKGFNPNDAAIEAAITYQSPKETPGVVKTNTVQVTQVTPEIHLSANNKSGTVRTVVKGKGLPNSFVTLYLFSSPTIVTVRTNADGIFEYTFNQELEDGQHQVYVALTDNNGSIIAQSEPFTFVKEAQAFTTVGEPETINTLTTSGISNQLDSYRIVLGMSVFALGMLLVLLGIGLRSTKPEILHENSPV